MRANNQPPVSLELEDIKSEADDSDSAPPEYHIATYPADFTLELFHQKWNLGELIIPEFQRRYVWKQPQASRLIESFLVGLPVPAVFLYNERATQKHLVIDGQQRLKSVFYYIDGYFGDERQERRRVFRLKGLNERSPFHELAFDDLQEEDQRRLKNAVLRAFIVNQLSPDDDTSVIHIFERLNTGGTLLTNQEIRHSVYHGSFSGFLDRFNELSHWRQILGKPDPDARKRDVELLLRFLALREPEGYVKPMKDYLSAFMRVHKDASESFLEKSGNTFERTCRTVVETLGSKPFHVRAGVNAAVLDAVMTAFSQNLDNIPGDIGNRYLRLLEASEFVNCTLGGTTDVDVVHRRLSYARSQLFNAAG